MKTGANVEIPFASSLIEDGVFVPSEKETAILDKMIGELESLATALKPLRS